MLALNTVGSTVLELCVCNVSLTCQHLLDLAALLERGAGLTVLKLDYVTVVDSSSPEQVTAAYKSLFSLSSSSGSSSVVSYISLRGDSLDDSFIAAVRADLLTHLTLCALNLAENRVSDAGAHELMRALTLAPTLRFVSLKRNPGITGQCLCVASPSPSRSCVAGCTTGTRVSAEEDADFKNILRAVAERNKLLKEVNKRRKKAGVAELEEFSVAALTARQGRSEAAGENTLFNQSGVFVDLSFNDIPAEYITQMLQQIASNIRSDVAAAAAAGLGTGAGAGTGAEQPPLLSLKLFSHQDVDISFIASQFDTKGVVKLTN